MPSRFQDAEHLIQRANVIPDVHQDVIAYGFVKRRILKKIHLRSRGVMISNAEMLLMLALRRDFQHAAGNFDSCHTGARTR